MKFTGVNIGIYFGTILVLMTYLLKSTEFPQMFDLWHAITVMSMITICAIAGCATIGGIIGYIFERKIDQRSLS